MNKKYALTDETIQYKDHILHRIKALKDFGDVKAGDLGGWIEKETNLSQYGYCWVHNDAKVMDKACVFEDAQISCLAEISDEAKIYGKSWVWNEAKISKNAKIRDNAKVGGYVEISGSVRIAQGCKLSGKVQLKGDTEIYNLWSGETSSL